MAYKISSTEAIAIIENEIKCVERASAPIGACDRHCEKCDLLKTDTEIIEALNIAIEAIKRIHENGE